MIYVRVIPPQQKKIFKAVENVFIFSKEKLWRNSENMLTTPINQAIEILSAGRFKNQMIINLYACRRKRVGFLKICTRTKPLFWLR